MCETLQKGARFTKREAGGEVEESDFLITDGLGLVGCQMVVAMQGI